MARKSGALNTARIPASKPEDIDEMGIMKMPMRKPTIMNPAIQSSLGDLEYEAEVRPEFISPIGILGLDPKMTDIVFEPDPFIGPQGFYKPSTDRMTIADVSDRGLDYAEDYLLDKLDRKQYRAVKENPTIEHEAIHRGLQILADYYDYDEVAKRFDVETADFLFENATKAGRLASEVITELNDARRLGLKDYETFVNRFRNKTTLEGGDKELKLFMAKSLAYLPAMEELAKERLYDRNPEGGPTRDARGLAKDSLDKNFYKDKRVKKNILSDFVGNIRQKFRDFVTKKPDFEETSKQMPKEFNKGGDTKKEKDLEKGYAEEAKRLAVETPKISFKDATKAVAEMTPIVGDAMAAKEIYDELKKEDPNYLVVGILGGATLIGLIPGVGDVAAKLIRKGADLAKRIDVDVNALGSTGGNITFKKDFRDAPIEQRNVEFRNTDLSIQDFDNLKIFNREEGFGSTGTQSEKRRRIKTVILPIDEALKLFPDRGYTYMDDVGKAYMDSMESSIKKATQGAKAEEFTGFKPYERLRGTKYGKDMTEEDFQFETKARGVGIPFVSVGYNKKGNTLLSTNHEGAHRLLILKKLGHRFAPVDVLFNRELDMKNTNLNRVMKEARNLVGKQEFSLDRKKRQGGKANVVKGFDTAIKPEDYDIKFNKGGVAMERQMEMAFMQEGGLKDDGMDKDPVSGNEVPSGSLAEEVRDDIPVQLSEGEYVVPADVVRFFGVKFFEDLRMQAKMGLAQMEESGRIGGEPIKEPMSVTVVESEEMLDPEDEKKIREMLKGFSEGGLQDFREAPPPLDLRKKFGVVGGSLFKRKSEVTEDDIIDGKADGSVTYYHPDGREFKVEYKNGAVVNENQIQYTVPPWSRTKPNQTPNVSPSEIGGSSGDEDRPSGGAKFTQPNLVEKYGYLKDKEDYISTEILANLHNEETGENRLAFFDDNGNPVKMTKEAYDNLYKSYTSLGGDKNFPEGIAQYANLSFGDKIALMPQQIRKAFGYDVSEAKIKQILKASQDRKALSRMQVNPSILSFILDILSPDKTLFSTNLTAREASPDAREPLTVQEKVIERLSDFTTGIDGTVGSEGFINFGKFLQGETNSRFGMTAIDRALLGVKMDGDQPMIYDGGLGRDRKLTGSDLQAFAKNMDTIKDARRFSHNVFMETGDAFLADEAYHQDFLDQSAEITKNEQLAAEARRKSIQSRNLQSDEEIIQQRKDAKEAAERKRREDAEKAAKKKREEEQKQKRLRDKNRRDKPTQSGPVEGDDNDGGGSSENVFGDGYYQPNPKSDYRTDYNPPPPTGQSPGFPGGGPTTSFGGGYSAPPTYDYGGTGPFNKGGLASKPKAKPKRKKNTKGLGTKPKAT